MNIRHIENPDNLPVIPPLPQTPRRPADGAIAICGECGRRIGRIESYSCPNDRCPVQPRAAFCPAPAALQKPDIYSVTQAGVDAYNAAVSGKPAATEP